MFKIKEFDGVFCDAVAANLDGSLLFASLYGRDSIMKQLLASFSLPASQGGLNRFTVLNADQSLVVRVEHVDELGKEQAVLDRTMFGKINHCWLFENKLKVIDHQHYEAWVVNTSCNDAEIKRQLWASLKQLSPLPLLDDWMDHLFESLGTSFYTKMMSLGQITVYQTYLPVNFTEIISELVKQKVLTLKTV